MSAALVIFLVVLAVLLMLLAFFRTSKGRELLIKYRIKERATAYMVDLRPATEVRENGFQGRHLARTFLHAELPTSVCHPSARRCDSGSHT